jgi:dephospho-CoA kinase
MMIVGLTGGIGSGKSTVAEMFADLDIPVYNSDREAKSLMVDSKVIRKQIKNLLGKESYIKKKLNRKYIATKVFASPDLLAKLNAIVHPAVREHFLVWVAKQKTPYVIQETAIIFENSSQDNYDKIILVTAPEAIRINRVIDRDDITEAKVKERISNQFSDIETSKLSDFVIINLELKETKEKVREIHKQLLKIASLRD